MSLLEAPSALEVGDRRGRPVRTVTTCLVLIIGIALPASPVGQIVVLGGLTMLVGTVVLTLLGVHSASLARHRIYAAALGLCTLAWIWGAWGWIGFSLGIDRPYDRGPTGILWVIILLVLVLWATRSGADPVSTLWSVRSTTPWASAMVFTLLPLSALVGAWRLNAGHGPTIAIVVATIDLCLLIGLLTGMTRWLRAPATLQLFSLVLTLIWQLPSRGGFLFGSDIQAEWFVSRQAIAFARFPVPGLHDPYGGMLSLTAVPAQAHALTGIDMATYFQLVPGIFLALLVVASYLTLARISSPRIAACITVFVTVASAPFLQSLPTITRQCDALFVFAVLLLVITDRPGPVRRTRVLLGILGTSIVVLHYSTSYLTISALVLAALAGWILIRDRSRRLLTLPVLGITATITILWDAVIANVGSSVQTTVSTVRSQGLQLLPASGGFLTQWIQGAQPTTIVSPHALRLLDLQQRATRYHWLTTFPGALRTTLRPSPVKSAHDPAALSRIFIGVSGLLNQLLIVAILIALALALVRLRHRFRAPEFIGLGLFALLISIVSRLSGTLALQFAPDRIRGYCYLIFSVLLAVAAPWWVAAFRRQHKIIRVTGGVLMTAVVTVALLVGTGLGGILTGDGSAAAYSTSGDTLNRFAVSPSDLEAAQWIAANAENTAVLQADPYAGLNLEASIRLGRTRVVGSVDPVLLGRDSWIYASTANVVAREARGKVGNALSFFAFPRGFLRSHYNVLYASGSNAIYGSTR